jgi:hypothetical protein
MWYVVAVERDVAGVWKLAFVSWAGTKAAPPLQSVTHSSGYTAAVTAAARARMSKLAVATAADLSARTPHVANTSWGATIHQRISVDPARDGIYGLSLPSGQVLSCFAMHLIEAWTSPSGVLLQGPTQTQWGYQLAPGSYSSITGDNALPTCAVGSGVGSAGGHRLFSDNDHALSTTGVPA